MLIIKSGKRQRLLLSLVLCIALISVGCSEKELYSGAAAVSSSNAVTPPQDETRPSAGAEGVKDMPGADDPAAYLLSGDTAYHVFAPGIINPHEGTIEFTVRIDRDHKEFGNKWEFLFQCISQQEGSGDSLFGAYIPPPLERPAADTYEQDLIFFIDNGGESSPKRITARAKPETLAYPKGEAFNLAFVWKMGAGGYAGIYRNGVEIARSDGSAAPVLEQFMNSQMWFSRTAPFRISNLKISTAALPEPELESSVKPFQRGEHTALLSDITYGRPVSQELFQTPYHIASGYSVAKPMLGLESQVYYAGEAASLPFLLLNCSEDTVQYSIAMQGSDQYSGNAFAISKTVSIPPDGAYHLLAIRPPLTQVGFYEVVTTVTGPAGAVEYASAFSVLPAPDNTEDGAFAGRYGQHISLDVDMRALAKMNVTATRTWSGAPVFTWDRIEPEDNRFEWDEADAYVMNARSNGIDVYAVLGYPSAWASTRPAIVDHTAPMEQSDFEYRPGRHVSKDIATVDGIAGDGNLWRDYVYQVMKRYAGQVKYYEVINEVNFHKGYLPAAFSGTADEYFLMQKIAYEEAQRVKREYLHETGQTLELYVSTSGFSYMEHGLVDLQMVLDALNEENSQYYDIFSIHGYAGVSVLGPVLDALGQARKRKPELQFWQGEYYAYQQPEISWRVYSTIENCVEFLALGVDKYFNMGVSGDNYFVSTNTQSPTPMFQAMAVLQQNIRKADTYGGEYKGFGGESAIPVRHYFLRTDGNCLSTLVSQSGYEVLLDNPESVLFAVDAYGKPVPMQGDSLTTPNSLLVVSRTPLVIREARQPQYSQSIS